MGAFEGPHVRWLRDRDDVPAVVRQCLGCGAQAPMPAVVEATDPVERGRYRRFVRCPACGTYLLEPLEMPDYGGELGAGLAADRYFEVGAGVDFMSLVLSSVPAGGRASARMIDVGCGCGFSVHYWRSFGRDAMGVEPSALATVGAPRLGVEILRAFAGSSPELEGRRFDVVLSTEVVEHVPDPGAFVRVLASLRSEEGRVVFSTPDAGRLDFPGAADLEAWEVLSPGFHAAILSEGALRLLCARAGLADVVVERAGLHLVCNAGATPGRNEIDWRGAQRDYRDYLVRETARGAVDPALRDGLDFRLLQHVLNFGDPGGAGPVVERLLANLRVRYGFDVGDAAETFRRIDGLSRRSGVSFGGHIPWFVLELHHGLGILAAGAPGGRETAERHFDLVVRAAPLLVSMDPSILPIAMSYAFNARYQLAALALAGGSVAGMEDFLALEMDRRPENADASPGRDILAIASTELFKSHVLSRRWDAARAEEPRVLRLLARAFGAADLDVDRIHSWVRANPTRALEERGALHALVWASLARAILRLRGDFRPGKAARSFRDTFRLLAVLRELPGGDGLARALGERPGRKGGVVWRWGRRLWAARKLVFGT